MSPEGPLIYLVLGASGSGRREVLADLIDGGLGADDRAAVLVSEGEKPLEKAVGGPEPTAWRWIPPHAPGECGRSRPPSRRTQPMSSLYPTAM